MWRTNRSSLDQARGAKVTIDVQGRLASFSEVVQGWRNDEGFRVFFIEALKSTPFSGFFWEMPPIVTSTLSRPFEYVTIQTNAFQSMAADPLPFISQLDNQSRDSSSVVSFRNLGGDALLLVSRETTAAHAYSHIGAFVRAAPIEQIHELLMAMAVNILSILGSSSQPLWVSTSGLGVPWLHIRFDRHPKYYAHKPYRDAAFHKLASSPGDTSAP
jgi:hypothetical protein